MAKIEYIPPNTLEHTIKKIKEDTSSDIEDAVRSKAENSAVSNLSNRLDTLNSTVGGHTTSISSLGTRVSNLESNYTNITSKIASYETDLESLI